MGSAADVGRPVGEALRKRAGARCPTRVVTPGGCKPGQRHAAQAIDDAAEFDRGVVRSSHARATSRGRRR